MHICRQSKHHSLSARVPISSIINTSLRIIAPNIHQTMKVQKRRTSSFSAVSNYNVDRKPTSLEQQQQRLLIAAVDGENYGAGSNSDLNDMKIVPITPFQRKVYTALCLVPEGYVTTYQTIGQYIHCSSNQAIGQALKRNPYYPIIPCHRVIKSDGTIGGFHGQTSGEYISKKISLLQKEGVQFTSATTTGTVMVDPNCIFYFDTTVVK